ncbi:Eisosome component PIL1-domain-containing protein [Pilaira anomala]|nr:Eisosome component PIL1-domain-containing protein [Pilaira anomala]
MFSSFGNPFHKSDSNKPLSEKGLNGVLYYSAKSSRDITQFAENNRVSANNLMTFGALLGDDFNDVTNKLGNALLEWSNIMMEFSDSIDQYRENMKIISLKEASLQPGRDQKRKLREKIDQLQGSLSSLDKIAALEDQLTHLDHLTELDEIEMENFKRITTRKGLYTLLEGMSAMAGKTNIISTFGKNIVDELYVTPLKLGEERPIYQAEERTKGLLEYLIKSVEDWSPTTKVNNNHHHSKDLPPVPISSTSSVQSNSNDPIVLPPRHISLEEEQHKQYSFYKPDEVVLLEDQLDLSSPPPIPTQSTISPPIHSASSRPTSSTPPSFPTQSSSTKTTTTPPIPRPTQSTSTTRPTNPPIPRPTQSTSTGTARPTFPISPPIPRPTQSTSTTHLPRPIPPTSAPRPMQSNSTSTTTTSSNYRRPTPSPSPPPPPPFNQYQPGFSNFYLNTQQQNYPNYLPNKEYEELASSYHSGAVFRGGCDDDKEEEDDKTTTTKRNSKHDAGGFVLPSTNPNYIYPSTSTSTSST